MYVKVNNDVIEKFPYSILDLKNENPMTSFPYDISNDILEHYGVYTISEQQMPEIDRFSYCVKRHLPELINGQWVLLWDVIQKTQQQLDEETEIEAEKVRASRNKKLLLSDWTQVDDAPVDKQIWAAYRQALRDVPAQSGFPWEVNWPVEP